MTNPSSTPKPRPTLSQATTAPGALSTNDLAKEIKTATDTAHKTYEDPLSFGTTLDGEHLVWRPWEDTAMLIVGPSNSGTEKVAQYILEEMAARNWKIDAIDNSQGFVAFRGWPNVENVATYIERQLEVVDAAFAQMQSRYSELEKSKTAAELFTPYCLLIEGFEEFSTKATRWHSENLRTESTSPTLSHFDALLRMGRAVKMHVVIADHRPSLLLNNRDLFTCLVGMGKLSPTANHVLWDINPFELAPLPQEAGWGSAKNKAGEIVPFTATWATKHADRKAALHLTTTPNDAHK